MPDHNFGESKDNVVNFKTKKSLLYEKIMIRVCPLPRLWDRIYRELSVIASQNLNVPPPPTALILAGWNFSSDSEKRFRWLETQLWAEIYGGAEILSQLDDADFYYVDELGA